MSLNLNQVMLAGNLTNDPQVRFFANDKAVANFSLAINNKYKNSEGTTVEATVFVDIECWGRTAELVGQYLTKGRPCLIEGALKTDKWEDKETGKQRQKLKVNAQRVHFLGSPSVANDGDGGQRTDPARRVSSPDVQSGPIDDEPPF